MPRAFAATVMSPLPAASRVTPGPTCLGSLRALAIISRHPASGFNRFCVFRVRACSLTTTLTAWPLGCSLFLTGISNLEHKASSYCSVSKLVQSWLNEMSRRNLEIPVDASGRAYFFNKKKWQFKCQKAVISNID